MLRQADEKAADGARVLLLARSDGKPSADDGPGQMTAAALIVINQQLRPDAAETVAYFLAQDVTVKVISGDNATTVGALAMQAGVPGADKPVDARGLPTDPAELAVDRLAAALGDMSDPVAQVADRLAAALSDMTGPELAAIRSALVAVAADRRAAELARGAA